VSPRAEDVPLRVLILSADVGESHVAMARSLARSLKVRPDVASVTVLNDFAVLGPVLERVLPSGFEFHLGRVKWSYDLAYRLFTRVTPARRFGEFALYALGGSALAGTIQRHRPDVVISTYPVMNPVLGRLRAAGRLTCPVGAVVGQLGGLGF
jgi:processive 1,2-diacylglycerol beta-glucosyltransferase